MIPITKITGRMGNQMFEFAALYAFSRDLKVDYYFQDEKWFKKYEDEIRQMFGAGIGFLPRVGIHFRKGDYKDNNFYTDLSKTNYYAKSISLFPDEKFIVFSDEIDLAKEFFTERFKGVEFVFSEGNDEITDFNLLASCESQIIANSSFSIWCGILNPNPSKKVISPIETKYYSDGIVRTKIPSNFTQLDFEYE